jgi:hypothetical protein
MVATDFPDLPQATSNNMPNSASREQPATGTERSVVLNEVSRYLITMP